jgi:hypothetical protein
MNILFGLLLRPTGTSSKLSRLPYCGCGSVDSIYIVVNDLNFNYVLINK